MRVVKIGVPLFFMGLGGLMIHSLVQSGSWDESAVIATMAGAAIAMGGSMLGVATQGDLR